MIRKMMTLRDFRIGWRILLSQPAYSTVVVAGLAIGMAACFLLIGFVHYSFTYNANVPDNEHVYMIKQKRNMLPRPEWDARAPMPLRDALLNSGLPVTASIARSLEATARVETRLVPLALEAVDQHLPGMLGLRELKGDLAAVIARPDSIALTVASARKLFGASDVLGKTISIAGKSLRVDAILSDPPRNATFGFDGIVGTGSALWPQYAQGLERWHPAKLYVHLRAGAVPDSVLAFLLDALANSPPEKTFPERLRHLLKGEARITDVRMVAMSDVYFDPDLLASRARANHADRTAVLGLSGVAGLILLLAVANYVNLSTVRTLHRQREIGVRKVMGASSARLAGQFIAESIVAAAVSTVLGLLLAWLLLPTFSDLVDRQLEGFFAPIRIAAAALLGLVVGSAAALYPAWIAMRMIAGDTLRGRGSGETPRGMWVRRLLTIAQFAVAIALTGTTLAVAWQTRYAIGADSGFNPTPLLIVDLPENASGATRAAFKDRLTRLPGVAGVAGISEAVGRDGSKIVSAMRGRNGQDLSMELKVVTPEFFDVYQLAPLAGRAFQPSVDRIGSTNVMLNASAARTFGFPTPEAAVGQTLADGSVVIGIAPDLRFRTLRQAHEPLVYTLRDGADVLTVRADFGTASVRAPIERLWQEFFPNDVIALELARDLFAPNYAEDRRLVRMLGMSSVIAGALAAFGIYVLSAYNVQRRAKEIVLRKLHGASRADIARLVGLEFLLLTGSGAMVGLPFAALASERYLASFVERAPMGIWPLIAALGFAAIVALVATLRHTMSAMRTSPTQVLRS